MSETRDPIGEEADSNSSGRTTDVSCDNFKATAAGSSNGTNRSGCVGRDENSDLVPTGNGRYGCREYWEERYKTEVSFDWFVGYSSIKELLARCMQVGDRVLNLGCGNSSLPLEMWNDGYRDITNIDYSSVVIEAMTERTNHMTGLQWMVVDMTEMSQKFEPQSFDVVLEKGTIDALLVSESDPWRFSDEAEVLLDGILQQVSDILRPGGRFISIAFCQPHFLLPFYANSKYGWGVGVETIGTDFHYFCYVLTKGDTLAESHLGYREDYLKRKEWRQVPVELLSDDDDEGYLFKIDSFPE